MKTEQKELDMASWATAQVLKSLEKGRAKHGGGTWETETVNWHLTKSARHSLTAACELQAVDQPQHVKFDPHYQDGERKEDHLQCALARVAMANYSIRPYRVYLSGPITGEEDFGVRAFRDAEILVQETLPRAQVINPTTNYGGDTSLPRSIYMRRDLLELLGCDCILMLPNWEKSKGAQAEHLVATQCGIKIEYLEDWEHDARA